MIKIIMMIGILSLTGCVAAIPIQPEADVTPPMIDPAAVNSIAIERVVSQIPRGEQIGVVKAGLLCIPHVSITAGAGQFNITDASYLDAIQHEFAVINYPITTSPTELFATGAADATRIRLAARITGVRENICFPLGGFGDFSNGTAEAFVQIEWQAYDRATKSIVLKTTTTGTGLVGSSTLSPGVLASDLAAGMATRRFIAGPEFQQLSVHKFN